MHSPSTSSTARPVNHDEPEAFVAVPCHPYQASLHEVDSLLAVMTRDIGHARIPPRRKAGIDIEAKEQTAAGSSDAQFDIIQTENAAAVDNVTERTKALGAAKCRICDAGHEMAPATTAVQEFNGCCLRAAHRCRRSPALSDQACSSATMRCRSLASGMGPRPACRLSRMWLTRDVAGMTQVTAGCETMYLRKNCAQLSQPSCLA